MEDGDLLVRCTIWLSLAAYAASEAGRTGVLAIGPTGARILWTAGCALYVAHVLTAFTFAYAWSHAVAFDSTARQTSDLVGLDWGGGLYVSYAFSALWVAETAWWWLRPQLYLHRRRRYTVAVRSVFLFMIVNGAVVFVDGALRWVGLALVGVLLVTWLRDRSTT